MKRAGTTNTKSTNSIKKAASDIIDYNKPSEKKQANTILTTGGQSGVKIFVIQHGLWCIANEKKNAKEDVKSKGNIFDRGHEDISRKNDDFLSEVDKKLIEKLKRQVVELSVRLDTAMSKCSESEYLAQRAENNRQIFSDVIIIVNNDLAC